MAHRPSAEDRTVVVADRAARGVGPHEQEAVRAELLVGPLRLQPVAGLAAVVGLLVVLVVVLVLGRDQAVLEDAVEVGLDVVGREQVVVLVLLLLAGARPALGAGGRRVVGVVLVLVLVDLLVVDDLDVVVLVVEDERRPRRSSSSSASGSASRSLGLLLDAPPSGSSGVISSSSSAAIRALSPRSSSAAHLTGRVRGRSLGVGARHRPRRRS